MLGLGLGFGLGLGIGLRSRIVVYKLLEKVTKCINHVTKTDQWRAAPQIRPAAHFVVSQSSTLCGSVLILGSKGQGSRAQGPLACVFSDCCRTHDELDEEPYLPLPIFIHDEDVVRWRVFASPQSALSF